MSTSISATEIGLPDDAKLKLGTGEDLEIYHDGSNSYITESGTGSLYIKSSAQLYLQSYGGENFLKADANGAVELYHNNNKKFETTSVGVSVTGTITSTDSANVADGHVLCQLDSGNGRLKLLNASDAITVDIQGSAGNVNIVDDGKFQVGNSNDLQIYHNGTNSYVRNSTGQLLVGGSGGDLVLEALGDVRTVTWEGENMIYAKRNGAVELYYDNTKRFETLTDGTQSRGLTKHLSEDQNVTQTIQPLYLSIPTNSTKTITLTLLLGTGRFTAGGYANAGQGALALNIFFGGAMFATQHYDVNVLQNNAMQNTSTSLTKNGTSYVIAITNNSSSYPLNLSMLLESTGRTMNYAVA